VAKADLAERGLRDIDLNIDARVSGEVREPCLSSPLPIPAAIAGAATTATIESEKDSTLKKIVLMLSEGKAKSQAPPSVCPALFQLLFSIRAGTELSDRNNLWQFANRLIDSRADQGRMRERVYRIIDWTVREALPAIIEAEGFHGNARYLRQIGSISDPATLAAAGDDLNVIDPALLPGTQKIAIDKASNVVRCTGYIIKGSAGFDSRFAATFPSNMENVCAYAIEMIELAQTNFRSETKGSAELREELAQMQLDLLDELCPDPLDDLANHSNHFRRWARK